MVIHEISDTPAPALQAALALYESKFLYPLSSGAHFRIDHGPDRTAFLRSRGADWCLLAAESDGVIRGTMELALSQLQPPGAAPIPAVSCNEIRVLEEARRKTVAARLLQRSDTWVRARATALVSVVNDQNPLKPSAYTGRIGIEKIRLVGAVSHIRIPLHNLPLQPSPPAGFTASEQDGLAAFARLAAPFARLTPTSAVPRSIIPPRWLIHSNGAACARIEDRRRVIRLITTTGSELRPAFLSCFAFSDPASARDLIAAACAIAAHAGCAALRFYLPAGSLDSLRAPAPAPLPSSPAAIYGAITVPTGLTWLINASDT